MKIRTLVCCSLFVIGVNAQTKEAEFGKLQDLLKKSNGIKAHAHKVLDYTFNEKTIQLEAEQNGSSYSIVAKNLKWQHFDYVMKKMKEDSKTTEVTILFEDDIEVLAYQNKKQVDKAKDSRVRLYINSSDAQLVEQQLDELKLYTWKELSKIRESTKEQLVAMITKNINAAIQEDNGKLTRLDPCFIAFTYPNRQITFPLKGLKLHEMTGGEVLFCFGKEGSFVITKNNSGETTETKEHPDVNLDFEKADIAAVELQFALKKLSSSCVLNSIFE